MNNIGWSRKPENKGYALVGKWEMGRPNIALLMGIMMRKRLDLEGALFSDKLKVAMGVLSPQSS
jgi:hypothetical protein